MGWWLSGGVAGGVVVEWWGSRWDTGTAGAVAEDSANRKSRNIGGDLNLAIWRLQTKPPYYNICQHCVQYLCNDVT